MHKQTSQAGSIFRFRRLTLAAAVLATCGVAHAQQDTTTTDQSLDRVTVTGSNLHRSDTETPSPVQVITLDEIKQSGYTDVSDVLHNLTANGAGTLSQSFGGAFAAGGSGIALRGLSVGATLVLIDGHRPATNALTDDGERNFVDVSQIPLEAIDRIEVLKDGASSIYGSDAIAGVINVILKKSYVGGEVSAEYGVSKYWDARVKHVTGTYGFGDLDADGHNAYIALEYREQDAAYAAPRPYLSNQDFTSTGGNNLTAGFPGPYQGPTVASLSGYFLTPAATNTPTSFLPGCNPTAYNSGKCQFTVPNPIQTPTQNINVLGSFTQNLGGGWQIAAKASLFDEHTSTTQGYFDTLGAGAYTSSIVGPGVPPSVYAPGGTGIQTLVPASYPGNKTGAPAYLAATFGTEQAESSEDSQLYRFAVDLTGSIYGFDITASAGYSESLIYTNIHAENYAALNSALTNVANPYRVGSAFYLNSAAANNAVFPNIQGKADNSLSFLTLEASRDVYQLPGGPLSIGVGLDYRHQDLDAEAPPAIANGFIAGNNAFAVGTQNVAAVYAEAAAPVFKWLEVDASVRHDSYAGSFSNTDPKIGFKITPIEQVAFRGTYSEGFRAPNPAESGNAGESFLIGAFPDAILCPTGDPTAPGSYVNECSKQPVFLQESNPNLKPEKSHSYTLGLILEPIKGYSVSLDYYNITVNNQIVPATADPNFFGNLLGTTDGAVRSAPVAEPFIEPNGTVGSATPPVGAIVYYPLEYVNASKTQTSGVDLDARAKFDLWNNWGKLTFDLTETHVFHYVQGFDDTGTFELAGTHGPSEVSGDTGNPKDRAQFIVTYDRGPLSVTSTVNWTAGFDANDPSQGQTTCQDAIAGGYKGYYAGAATFPSDLCRIKSYTEWDLYANYKITKALSVHASVLNVLNKNAPLDYATYGGGANGLDTPYGPAYAQQGAIGRYVTVGAQYRF